MRKWPTRAEWTGHAGDPSSGSAAPREMQLCSLRGRGARASLLRAEASGYPEAAFNQPKEARLRRVEIDGDGLTLEDIVRAVIAWKRG